MDNKTIIERIAEMSAPARRSLMMLCQKHSEAQCNGDYYYDDDANNGVGAWVGSNAVQGRETENEIRAKIMAVCKTDEIPSFIGYSGDPRGFVLKMFSSEMSAEDIALVDSHDFVRDWGHDYSFMKQGEYDRS